jgi:hypothetical protein
MVEPLRHRQTKGAATAMFYLTLPRHISTLPNSEVESHLRRVRPTPMNGHRQTEPTGPFRANSGSRLPTHAAISGRAPLKSSTCRKSPFEKTQLEGFDQVDSAG